MGERTKLTLAVARHLHKVRAASGGVVPARGHQRGGVLQVAGQVRRDAGQRRGCLLAFVVYGGWAFGVNVRHGLETARAAGVAQGVSSTVSTVIITSLIELCLKGFGGHRGGALLAWLVPPTLTGLMHAGFQWAVGTPEILTTVLFSVLMGYGFAGVYVRGVLRLQRARAQAEPRP
jgi:hypothetical protein